jgi:hypothetical protein
MRRVLMIALATAAVGLGTAVTPAEAATLQLCTSGASCVSGTTNVNLDAFDAPGSATVTGTVGVGGPGISFQSNAGATLLLTNPGAATIFTASGALLNQLTFTLAPGFAFSAAEFDLLQGSPKAIDVVLTTSAGDIQVVSITNSAGSNIFDIIGGAGETFTSASFVTTAPAGFQTFKQLRLVLAQATPPVPEPGTWGLMLLGFAGVGMALRRSRRRGGALMQIA